MLAPHCRIDRWHGTSKLALDVQSTWIVHREVKRHAMDVLDIKAKAGEA